MRILFVAMAASIHTVRWVEKLRDTGWDIHLFPVENVSIHPELQQLILHRFMGHKPVSAHQDLHIRGIWPFSRGAFLVKRQIKKLFPAWDEQAWLLARTIRQIAPDVVHSLEMQHAAYLTFAARKHCSKSFPPWIYSCWGNDIFFFQDQPEHQERITEVLTECDYYIADCQRDVDLAIKFGLHSPVLGVFPVTGGFDVREMQQLRQPGSVSSRRVILLKGRTEWTGRALAALQALQMDVDILKEYEIIIFLADDIMKGAATYVAAVTGLRITLYTGSHEEFITLMGKTRIAIGVTVSDGTPVSMLEAMIMGAFPIQSDVISTGEWIVHGRNGFLVPYDHPETIAAAIRQAVLDDELVNQAAELNSQIALERIDCSVLQPQIIEMYEKVMNSQYSQKDKE